MQIEEEPNQLARRFEIKTVLSSRTGVTNPVLIEALGYIVESPDIRISYRLSVARERIELEGRESSQGDTYDILENMFFEEGRTGQDKVDIADVLDCYSLGGVGIAGNLPDIFRDVTESESVKGQAIAMYIRFEPDNLQGELNPAELETAKRLCAAIAKNYTLDTEKRYCSLDFLEVYGEDVLA